jgi:hypothetical protein
VAENEVISAMCNLRIVYEETLDGKIDPKMEV